MIFPNLFLHYAKGRSSTAAGKPSFTYFKDEAVDFPELFLHDATAYKRSGPTRVGGDGFLPYRLAREPILAAEVSIARTVLSRPARKKSPTCIGDCGYGPILDRLLHCQFSLDPPVYARNSSSS